MFSISANQHSKILGFALIAYSLQLFFPTLKFLFNIGAFFADFLNAYLYIGLQAFFEKAFYGELSQIFSFLIILISGISILFFRNKLKFLALAFVFLALTAFPIGTILSFYTLCYLFVISENKTEIEQKLSEETE